MGGVVRILMRRPDGSQAGARGEYTPIDRPRHLVMTWTFDDELTNRQSLELSFTESEGSTTVLLINSGSRLSAGARAKTGGGAAASLSSSGCCRSESVAGRPERYGPRRNVMKCGSKQKFELLPAVAARIPFDGQLLVELAIFVL